MIPALNPSLDPNETLAVALEPARLGLAEGGVIVDDSVNGVGGAAWLREKGFDIVDLHSRECIEDHRQIPG